MEQFSFISNNELETKNFAKDFASKLNKGDVYLDTLKYVMQRVDKYFTQSEITKEKIDFIENKTGLNLSLYRSKVKKWFKDFLMIREA